MEISVDHFNLAQIAQSGQCFRWKYLDGNTYRITAYGKQLTVRQESETALEMNCPPQEFDRVWRRYFDLDTDYAAIIARIDPETDAYLAAAAAEGAGIRILRQPLWETLASFLISQNNNIPRITGIITRLCQDTGDFPPPEHILAVGEARLRTLGLGYRAPYLLSAARRFLEEHTGERLPRMDYAQARAELTSYYGIGEKVADCVCLFGLHHLEAFPMDKWIKQVVRLRYGGHFPLERYPGVQGVMQQYLFCYERSLAAKAFPAARKAAAALPDASGKGPIVTNL